MSTVSARGAPSPETSLGAIHPLLFAQFTLGGAAPSAPILEVLPLVLGEDLLEDLVEPVVLLLERLHQLLDRSILGPAETLEPFVAGAAAFAHDLAEAVTHRG